MTLQVTTGLFGKQYYLPLCSLTVPGLKWGLLVCVTLLLFLTSAL